MRWPCGFLFVFLLSALLSVSCVMQCHSVDVHLLIRWTDLFEALKQIPHPQSHVNRSACCLFINLFIYWYWIFFFSPLYPSVTFSNRFIPKNCYQTSSLIYTRHYCGHTHTCSDKVIAHCSFSMRAGATWATAIVDKLKVELFCKYGVTCYTNESEWIYLFVFSIHL